MVFLASGCLWGVVRDADTTTPVRGVTVRYTDAEGRTNWTRTDANGIYTFDQASGPVPAAGPASFQVSAPGYEPLTTTRPIAYDDGPNASLDDASTFWEVQHFKLEPQRIQVIEVELLTVDVNKALLAPPTAGGTVYLAGFRLYDRMDLTSPVCEEDFGWFPISSTDPAPQSLDFDCEFAGDGFRAEVTVTVRRPREVVATPEPRLTVADTSAAAFSWVAPSPETAWHSETLGSTDTAGPDDPDLEFKAQIRFRSVLERVVPP